MTASRCFVAIIAGGLIWMVVGCQGRASIPAGATEVQSGTGRVSYTAKQTGNVYVLDHDENKKVFEGQLKRDDQIIVEPDQDKIVVAGENADHNEALTNGHRYGIYFTSNP